MHVADLLQRLSDLGARPSHAARVCRAWLHTRPLDAGRVPAEHALPATLRAGLPALQADLQGLARVHSEHPGEDGSLRLLVELADGRSIESVLMASGARGGLCVSTQVGCAVACRFCMTGQGGLQRQLGSAEILTQVVLARARRAVHKVVFMGMGEPAHNLDAVLEAIDALADHGGIGHKDLVLSTVGDRRVFERLDARRVRPALALSLHSTDDARRARLLPQAPRVPVAELVASADAYARASGYPVQLQWTLLAGVNDGDDEVEALVPLLRGRHAMLNLIPYNTVPGLPFARPDGARAAELSRRLNRAGVLTRLRRSAGQDVDAGCGQLRARLVPVPVSVHAGGPRHTTSAPAATLQPRA